MKLCHVDIKRMRKRGWWNQKEKKEGKKRKKTKEEISALGTLFVHYSYTIYKYINTLSKPQMIPSKLHRNTA